MLLLHRKWNSVTFHCVKTNILADELKRSVFGKIGRESKIFQKGDRIIRMYRNEDISTG